MKTSALVAATSAVLAMASPLQKREIKTDIVMEYHTVTVTGGEAPQPTFVGAKHFHTEFHTDVEVESFTTTEQAPVVVVTTVVQAENVEPTSTPPVVVYVTATAEADPEPTTSEVPVEVPTTSEIPVVEAPATSTSTSEAAAEPTEPAGDDMPSAAVYHHNLHRSNHSAPELTWDNTLAGYAANTAATCVFKHDMDQGSGGYGQNLAMWAVSDGAADLGEAGAIKMATTDMWYDGEFAAFKPEFYGQADPDMSNFESWGHLSQLLWKSTETLGCATQFCAKGTMFDTMDAWYMVCDYGPQGNVAGQYGTNVLAPLGKASIVA
ncbi:scp-like extracellular protein [Xylariomycetidae sp. FL2044]|nr:scp-like extracellular protein [Xylariomycetidae sp. FL2044]